MPQANLLFGSPKAHKGDPITSHRAIANHEASGRAETHRAIVLAALRMHGGRTGRELAAAIPDMDYHEVYRRLSDLLNDEQARQGEQKTCWIAKKRCVTWWAI